MCSVHRHREPLPVSQYAAVGPRPSRPRSGPAKAAWAARPTSAGRGALCAGMSQPMEDATGFDDVGGEANRSTMAAERRGR